MRDIDLGDMLMKLNIILMLLFIGLMLADIRDEMRAARRAHCSPAAIQEPA